MTQENSENGRIERGRFLSGKLGSTRRILTSNVQMLFGDPFVHFMDANGSDRTIALPALSDGHDWRVVSNIGAANVLNLTNAKGLAIATLRIGESAICFGSAAEWIALRGWASLSVFGPAGVGHKEGLVPDPGPTAGLSRFLEDSGNWVSVATPGIVDAYKIVSDGTNSATASGLSALRVRSSDSSVTITITDNDPTYGDVANFVVNPANVNHNLLLNYVSNQHIDHSSVSIATSEGIQGGGDITATRTLKLDYSHLGTATPGLTDTVSYFQTATHYKTTWSTINGILDHNALTNFVANKHIDHSGVSIIAGTGLSGGGDITTSRTLNLSIGGLSTTTTMSSTDLLPLSHSATMEVITFANFNAALDHNALTNFVANKHIDHSAVTVTGTGGLSGGGDITTSRTISLLASAVGTLGGVKSSTAAAHNWLTGFDITGTATTSQPAFSDISGNIATSQMNSGTSASSSTFWRGDGTWATPVGGVTSVFTRTGAVVAATNDYSFGQISGNISTSQMNSGTLASSTTFWRGDGTWATPAGAGTVSGPISSTNNGFAVYNGTTGQILKDHAATISLTSEVSGVLPTANLGSGSATSTSVLFGDQTYKTVATIATSGSASDLASGTVPTARLGSGSASAATYLRGDQTWYNTDTDRQNFLLDSIYQSKVFIGYRRLISRFADGYKASDGINAGSSSNYTVNSSAGNVAPSTAVTSVQIDTNSTPTGIGNDTYLMRDVAVLNSVTVNSIGVYSTSANTISVKLGLRNSAGNYNILVDQSFAHPGGGWADCTLGTPFTVPGTGTYYVGAFFNGVIDVPPGTPARAFITGNQGVASGVTLTENTGVGPVMRYSYGSGVNNMTVVTTTQTADASVSNGRVLLEYDNTATPTLGTDLTVEVTCNGGTNWTTATLSSISTNGQSGHKVVETADTATTAGTSFAARVKTLNNKNVPVYGLSLTVH